MDKRPFLRSKYEEFIMGAVSGAGGYAINNYGQELGRAGKIASSAVLGGVVSEIGGGKFANGAITAAYSMMFNEMMHGGEDEDGGKDGWSIIKARAKANKIEPDMRLYEMDRPLEIVPIEFGVLCIGRSVVTGALSSLVSAIQCETGGLSAWIIISKSYSNSGKFYTKKSVRWGSNKYYRNKKIGSPTLRKWNGQLRNTKLPGNNWRVNDPGHLH